MGLLGLPEAVSRTTTNLNPAIESALLTLKCTLYFSADLGFCRMQLVLLFLMPLQPTQLFPLPFSLFR